MSAFSPTKPPNCVFMPETALFNKIIETVARNGDNMNLVFAKFSDFELPKPQWMIDQDREKA